MSHKRRQEDDGPKKEKPNFSTSGKLAEEQNTYRGVILKYSEPPEARKPQKRFRIYVFKKEEQIDTLHLHQKSCYMFGRDRTVVDVPLDHPSCSKQHAVLQYRQVTEQLPTGEIKKTILPYLIDLKSANGTQLNGHAIDASRYIELKNGDVIHFGMSTRDYVFIDEEAVE